MRLIPNPVFLILLFYHCSLNHRAFTALRHTVIELAHFIGRHIVIEIERDWRDVDRLARFVSA